jgi:hypothetical protein
MTKYITNPIEWTITEYNGVDNNRIQSMD